MPDPYLLRTCAKHRQFQTPLRTLLQLADEAYRSENRRFAEELIESVYRQFGDDGHAITGFAMPVEGGRC